MEIKTIPLAEDRLNESHYIASYWKKMFIEAQKKSASDIHIEPNEPEKGKMAIRFGLMNSLVTYDVLEDTENIPSYLTKIELICGIDVTQKNVKQDKSIDIPSLKSRYRVSYGPPTSFDPESLVFRVIDEKAIPDLKDCHLPKTFSDDLHNFLGLEQGLFITTGGTGSGKSTTCQASLMSFDRERRKVISLEDPMERSLPWVRGYEISPSFTWEDGISVMMRQKPSVCFIGEIRDSASGFAALEAANKGHLVITTLHANSVSDTFKQLIKKFKFDYLDIESVTLCAAQRLVPMLCSHCKIQNQDSGLFTQGAGCETCYQKVPGLKGLRPIFEHCYKPTSEDVEEYRRTKHFPVKSTLKRELKGLINLGLADYRIENIYG